jgi:hypothetical protein
MNLKSTNNRSKNKATNRRPPLQKAPTKRKKRMLFHLGVKNQIVNTDWRSWAPKMSPSDQPAVRPANIVH